MVQSVANLVEAIPLPVLVIRRDQRIEAANDLARTLFGQGIVDRHYITALRQPDLLDTIEACLRDHAPRQADYLTSDDGQALNFRVTLRAVALKSGPGILLSFEDVTPVEQAGQMRRDFVANVSHELRSPLTALIGFIETLQGPAQEDAAGRTRFLSIMRTEAHRMNRLVDDLLSLSRVEAEERVRPTEQLDPADVIRSVLRRLEPQAEEAGVTLVSNLPDVPVKIFADQDQLQQVLTNLAENAIKYSGRGASVTVRLTPPDYEPRLRGDGIRIEVADTGPGIDAMHLPRLTERFYRVDTHRSREMGGTGLGLAIVKHIVNRHRGRLSVDSKLGQGTVFSVVLPST